MDRREFIRVTGASGIAFSGFMPLIACSNDDPDLERFIAENELDPAFDVDGMDMIGAAIKALQ